MELASTTLDAEYKLIEQEGRESYFRYEAIFVTAKEEIPCMQVTTTDCICDYVNASTDEMLISVVLKWGEYLNRVLPFKENLRLTLRRTSTNNTGNVLVDDRVEQTFTAILQGEPETALMGDSPETASEDASDLSGIKRIQVQLQEDAYALTRSERVGGVFRDTSAHSALMALLNQSINGMDLEADQKIKGIDTVPPSNTSKRSAIVIPHGTPLVAVAEKLQTQHGGIYNAGIGCYLKKGMWHVKPLYDHTRYDTAKNTALFVIPPTQRYKGAERTWRKVDDHLTVFITGGIQRTDPSEIRLLNEGNGARFPNADAMMEGFFEVSGNKATAKRTNNANEYEAISRKANNLTRFSEDMSTSNVHHEASKVASRNGAYLTLIWENSRPGMIEPNLQCEIGFVSNGVPAFINGVVIHEHAFSGVAGTGLHQDIHQVTTEIVVMVDRNSPAYTRFLKSQ